MHVPYAVHENIVSTDKLKTYFSEMIHFTIALVNWIPFFWARASKRAEMASSFMYFDAKRLENKSSESKIKPGRQNQEVYMGVVFDLDAVRLSFERCNIVDVVKIRILLFSPLCKRNCNNKTKLMHYLYILMEIYRRQKT